MFSFIRKSLLWLLLAPWAIWGAGVASNQLVLIANGGKFPVMVNPAFLSEMQKDNDTAASIAATGMIDDVHCLMTQDTHLNLLADIFAVRHDGIYSIGDALIEAGSTSQSYFIFLWVVLMAMKAGARRDDLIFRS